MSIFVMLTAAAYAFDPAHVEQLKNTRNCPKCDLSAGRLYGKNLPKANLSNANLSGATWTDGKKCAEGSIGKCK